MVIGHDPVVHMGSSQANVRNLLTTLGPYGCSLQWAVVLSRLLTVFHHGAD